VLGDRRDIRDGDPLSGLPGDDDAGLYLFENTHRCKAGTWRRRDSSRRGYQTRELLWSIDGCDIEPLGWKRAVANPFRDFASFGPMGDVNPVLVAIGDPDGIPDATSLPFRPGSENPAGSRVNGKKWESQGLFLPNWRLRNEIRRDSFDSYDQNSSLNELQWNRGASQQSLEELRELYLDLYTGAGSVSPVVPMNYDGVNDNATRGPPAATQRFTFYATDQQEAIWGCGAFYQTDCNGLGASLRGFDLANMEGSVTLQSFPWFEGTYFDSSWDTTRTDLPQPGTVDAVLQGDGTFAGNVDITSRKDLKKHGLEPGDVATGSVGARYEDDGNGIDDDGDGKRKDLWIIPGARYDPVAFAAARAALPPGTQISPYLQAHFDQYDINVDGSVGAAVHPFTGQVWAGEQAIASWNFLMLAAGLGAQDGAVSRFTLDRNQPLAVGRCSFRQPQYCSFVSGLAAQARNTSSSVRAGGTSRIASR
jgi:hypothetical protein